MFSKILHKTAQNCCFLRNPIDQKIQYKELNKFLAHSIVHSWNCACVKTGLCKETKRDCKGSTVRICLLKQNGNTCSKFKV